MINKKLTKIPFLIVIFSFIINVVFILIEINHECTGEDCPICYLLHQVKLNLDGFGIGKTSIILIAFFIFIILNIKKYFSFYYNKKEKTLIDLKVRLNN